MLPTSCSTGYALHCQTRAKRLTDAGMGAINGATVAYMMFRSVAKVNTRCWQIARIIAAKHDQQWSMAAMQEYDRLVKLTDAALAALDPEPHHKTQSAPSR